MSKALQFLEKYVRRVKGQRRQLALARGVADGIAGKYILGGSNLSLADLSIFNCIDEFLHGPRSDKTLRGVRARLESYYPELMASYEVVASDMAQYLLERQKLFAADASPL